MKGLLIALRFLTMLPVPAVQDGKGDFAASIRWFPVVGAILGGFIAGGAWLGQLASPWIGALVALVLWVALTGALHLDGLGDLADARGGSLRDPPRIDAILADPHTGSFAVVTIALQLIAKLVLLHEAITAQAWVALVLIPAAARIGPLFWARFMAPLHEGLGSRFSNSVRGADLVFWSAAFAVAAFFYPFLSPLPLFLLLWAGWLRARIGGISGDSHGAGIELGETMLLLSLAVVSP